MKSQIENLEKWANEQENRSAIVILTEGDSSNSFVSGNQTRLISSITALMLQEKNFTNLIAEAAEYTKLFY